MPLITNAEYRASPSAKKVLLEARKMVENGEIIRGSCWNWLNTAYTRAGFPKERRSVVFSSKKGGPYASADMLRPGDWVYHVNYSYHGIEHSGMFIGWTDRAKKLALMLSYGGEGRKKPGRYRVYDIKSVYHITRATEQKGIESKKGKTTKRVPNGKWLSVGDYAAKYGYSFSTALSMARSGTVPSEIRSVNGGRYTYMYDRPPGRKIQSKKNSSTDELLKRCRLLKAKIEKAEREVRILKNELSILQKSIHQDRRSGEK